MCTTAMPRVRWPATLVGEGMSLMVAVKVRPLGRLTTMAKDLRIQCTSIIAGTTMPEAHQSR